jgi:hypothetical protein
MSKVNKVNTVINSFTKMMKEAFGDVEKVETIVAETFKTMKVKDTDTILEFPSLEKGSPVSISSAEGSVPASDGEYVLEDDTLMSVRDGVIADFVLPVEAPVEDEVLAEEAPKEAESVDAPAEDTKVAELEERVKQLEELIKGLPTNEALSAFKTDVEKVAEDIDSKIELLSKVPTELSNDRRVEVKENELDKYTKLAEMYSKK